MSRKTTRRSQSVVPFGVGSIVEFEDEALMPAGLDAWPLAALKLRDDRLAQRLGVREFRIPPAKPEKGVDPSIRDHLPHVRFPRWHFCPRCRFLKKASLFSASRPKCDNTETSKRLGNKKPCAELHEYRRPKMRPLRFVAVCPAGHIEDFPWNAWAHSKEGGELDRENGCQPERLYFYATRGGGLFGLRVLCATCGSERHLRGATSRDGLKGLVCQGHRPWLGEDARETCPAPSSDNDGPQMFALQRGASNLYFPMVSSSILIPPFTSKLQRLVRERSVQDAVESERVDGQLPKYVFRFLANQYKVDADALERAYITANDGSASSGAEGVDETQFRHAEYLALFEERRESSDLLVCRPQDVQQYGDIVRNTIGHISLVERLAETRALTGFSRFAPTDTAAASLSREPQDWLPAFRVHGEGIFLALREDVLSTFEDKADGRIQAHLQRVRDGGRVELVVSRELVFLHTFAHLLIKRFSYEAGYGTSSIRERIYSAPPGHEFRMHGILLYTAAGDADGTLGGLVGLGRSGVLERVFERALEEAQWCAGDPICIESKGQGPESINLAACHACALLPETSCELQNRVLDRKTVLEFFRI